MANNGRVLLAATVTDVGEGPFVYPACEQCYSKITVSRVQGCQLYRCQKCRQVYNPDQKNYRYRLCLTITDSTTLASVTGFGGMLNSFFGVTATEFHNIYLSTVRSQFGASWENIMHVAVEQALVGQRLLFGLKTATPDVRLQRAKDGGVTLKDICQNLNVWSQRSTIRHLPEFIAVQIVRQTDSSSAATVVECLRHLMIILEENNLTPDVCADKAALLQHLNSCSRRNFQDLFIPDNFVINRAGSPSGISTSNQYDISFDSTNDQSSLQFSCDHSQQTAPILENSSFTMGRRQHHVVDNPLCTSNVLSLRLDELLKSCYCEEQSVISHSVCTEDMNSLSICPQSVNTKLQTKANFEVTEIVPSKELVDKRQMDHVPPCYDKSENKKRRSENEHLKEVKSANVEYNVKRLAMMHQNDLTHGCYSTLEVVNFEDKENGSKDWSRNTSKSVRNLWRKSKNHNSGLLYLDNSQDSGVSKGEENLEIIEPGFFVSNVLKSGKYNFESTSNQFDCYDHKTDKCGLPRRFQIKNTMDFSFLSQPKDCRSVIPRPSLKLSHSTQITRISASHKKGPWYPNRILNKHVNSDHNISVFSEQPVNKAVHSTSSTESCVQLNLQSSPHMANIKISSASDTHCNAKFKLYEENVLPEESIENCDNDQVSEFSVCGHEFVGELMEDCPESEGLELFLTQFSTDHESTQIQMNKFDNFGHHTDLKLSQSAQKIATCKERQSNRALIKQDDSDQDISANSKHSVNTAVHPASGTKSLVQLSFQRFPHKENNKTPEVLSALCKAKFKLCKENQVLDGSIENCEKDQVSEFGVLGQEFEGNLMEDYPESEGLELFLTQCSSSCVKDCESTPIQIHTLKNLAQNTRRQTDPESRNIYQQVLEVILPNKLNLPGFDHLSCDINKASIDSVVVADRAPSLFTTPISSTDHKNKQKPPQTVGNSAKQMSGKNVGKRIKHTLLLKAKSLIKQTLSQKFKISKKQTSHNAKMLTNLNLSQNVNNSKNCDSTLNPKSNKKLKLSQNVKNSANQTFSQINMSKKHNLPHIVKNNNRQNILHNLKRFETHILPNNIKNTNKHTLSYTVGTLDNETSVLASNVQNPKKPNLLSKQTLSQNVKNRKKQTLTLPRKHNLAEIIKNLRKRIAPKNMKYQKKQNLAHNISNPKKQMLPQNVKNSMIQTLPPNVNPEKQIFSQNVKNPNRQTLKLTSCTPRTISYRSNSIFDKESLISSNVTLRNSKRKYMKEFVNIHEEGPSCEKLHCKGKIEENLCSEMTTEKYTSKTSLTGAQNGNNSARFNLDLRPESNHLSMDGASIVSSVLCAENCHIQSSSICDQVHSGTTDKISNFVGNRSRNRSSTRPQFFHGVNEKQITSVNCEVFSDFDIEITDKSVNYVNNNLSVKLFQDTCTGSVVANDRITGSVDQLSCGNGNVTSQDMDFSKQNELVTEICKRVTIISKQTGHAEEIAKQNELVADISKQNKLVTEICKRVTTISKQTGHAEEIAKQNELVADISKQNEPVTEICKRVTTISKQTGHAEEIAKQNELVADISKQNELVTEICKRVTTISKQTGHAEEIAKQNELVADISKQNELVADISKQNELVADISKQNELVAEIPKQNELVADISKQNELVAEIPKQNELVADISKQNELVAEIPKQSELVAEIPKQNELVAEIPTQNELVAEIPKQNELVAEIPKQNELVTEISKQNELVAEISKPKELIANITKSHNIRTSALQGELNKLESSNDAQCCNKNITTCTKELVDRWQNSGHIEKPDSVMANSSEHYPVMANSSEHDSVMANSSEHDSVMANSSEHDSVMANSSEHDSVMANSSEHDPVMANSSENDPVIANSSEHDSVVANSSEHDSVMANSSEHDPVMANSSEDDPVMANSSEHNSVMANSSEHDSVMANSSEDDDDDLEFWCHPPTPQNPLYMKYKIGKSVDCVLSPQKMLNDSDKCGNILQETEVPQDMTVGCENPEANNWMPEHLLSESSHYNEMPEYLLFGSSHNGVTEHLSLNSSHINGVSEDLVSGGSQDLFSSDDDSLVTVVNNVNNHSQKNKYETLVSETNAPLSSRNKAPDQVEDYSKDQLVSSSRGNWMTKRVSFSNRNLEHRFFGYEIIGHLPVVSQINPDLKSCLKKCILDSEQSNSQDLFSESSDDTNGLDIPCDVKPDLQSWTEKWDSSSDLFSESLEQPGIKDMSRLPVVNGSFITCAASHCNSEQSSAKGQSPCITSCDEAKHASVCTTKFENDCSFDLYLSDFASEFNEVSSASVSTSEFNRSGCKPIATRQINRTSHTSTSIRNIDRTNFTPVCTRKINRTRRTRLYNREINRPYFIPILTRESDRPNFTPVSTREINRTSHLSVLSPSAGDLTLDCVTPDLFS